MISTEQFIKRRQTLADLLPGIPVLLVSGCDRYRNYRAYSFPFRASSHYLFFGGPNDPDRALLLLNGNATLYRPGPDADDEVWHGKGESTDALKARFEFQEVKDLSELENDLETLGRIEVLSLPSVDAGTNEFIGELLGRLPKLDEDPDLDLVDAMLELRRCQDEGAIESIREAAKASVELQKTVIGACRPGLTERELKGVYDHRIASRGWASSFQPIISVAGEVLHNPYYENSLSDGDLLLIDCGAELPDGYVGDLTRTVPVSGSWSPTQKALYDIVDKARAEAIKGVAPGVEFKDLHRKASLVIASGLVDLGILKGDPEELVDRGVHALFFCHGLGHLLGLDAHDMEDFGDRIGYPDGRQRSPQFGLSNLRLDRKLEEGMVVTIEPGYYLIPALLDSPLGKEFASYIDREVLERYADVRGIRVEDMVLVTEDGAENLSAELPTASDEIAELIGVGQTTVTA